MARIVTIAALLAVGSFTAACTGAGGPVASASENRGLTSVNQPIVERTDYVMEVVADERLSVAERQRLTAWFDSLGLGYGDRVFIDEGSYRAPAARAEIARVAAEYGILLSDGTPITAGDVPPGSVRVIVSRSTATVPGCPNWEQPRDLGASEATPGGYGCAVNSNLAAMIADPADLVLGQAGSGTGDPATVSKPVKVYRERVPTGTKGLDSGKGSK
jgi:pilus assembly protein CpaD